MSVSAAQKPLLPASAEAEEVCAFFGLDAEACDRLRMYVEELGKWNAAINLVARSTLPHAWVRHVADGVQLLGHLPDDAEQVIDLGSGSGVPGLVMALAAPERAPFVLVESNRRKCAFLKRVAQRAGIDITVVEQRIETLDARTLGVDGRTVITARALAALDKLLDMAAPLLETGASALVPKGRTAQAELAAARQRWHFDSQALPSVTDEQGVILKLWNIRHD